MIEIMHSFGKFKATYRNTHKLKVGSVINVEQGDNNNPEEIIVVPATWESWTGIVINTFISEEENDKGMFVYDNWAEIIYTPALIVTDVYDKTWKVGDTLYVDCGKLVKYKPNDNAPFCAKVVKKNKRYRLLFK